MKTLKISKIGIVLLTFMVVLFVAGYVLYSFSFALSNEPVKQERFQSVLAGKEAKARQTIDLLDAHLQRGDSLVALLNISMEYKDEIFYYIYQNNELIFWSDNQIVPPQHQHDFETSSTHYIRLPNNHAVYCCKNFGDYQIVALILISYEYVQESDVFENHFVADFKTDNRIQVMQGNAADRYTIKNADGNYLFSLRLPDKPVRNNTLYFLAYLAFAISFIAFFVFYAAFPRHLHQKSLSFKKFVAVAGGIGFISFLLLYFHVPIGYAKNNILFLQNYSANQILSSLGQLTFFAAYVISTIYLLHYFVIFNDKTIKKRYIQVIMMFVVFAVFVQHFYLTLAISTHSRERIAITNFEHFEFYRLWLHFLFAIWGLSIILLYFKMYSWLKKPKDFAFAAFVNVVFLLMLFVFSQHFTPQYTVLFCLLYAFFIAAYLIMQIFYNNSRQHFRSATCNVLYVLVITIVISMVVYVFEKERRNREFKNYAVKIDQQALDEEKSLGNILNLIDYRLKQNLMVRNLILNDSVQEAKNYINNKYFSKKWTDFETFIQVFPKENSEVDNYRELTLNFGEKIGQTEFYRLKTPQNQNSYIGIYELVADSLVYVVDIEPKLIFRSYSFPNLLISHTNDNQKKLNIAVGIYSKNSLTSSSGRYNYSLTDSWLPATTAEWTSFQYNKYTHYIFQTPNKRKIVVTDLVNNTLWVFLVYIFYSFLAYYILFTLYIWFTQIFISNKLLRISIIARFQYMFLAVFLICSASVFALSYVFLRQKNNNLQISVLEEKKSYIQKNLQKKYYWNQSLPQGSNELYNELQDLSDTYQTDINIYNNKGNLVGASQSTIFNNHLLSRKMSPDVFLTEDINAINHKTIGKLSFLITYARFYNGDYLPIGYIAIPQYFSKLDVNAETIDYLQFIIHFFVVAFLFSLIISEFIRRKISEPINNLNKKLRIMRIGRRNEKIEYHGNDEISYLVKQYNRAVDEIEKSAALLAKSERESAWKLMARQIAHEINNPLTPMKLSIQQLQRAKKNGSEQFNDYFAKSTTMLIEQIDNLSHIARTFSDFAKIAEKEKQRVNIVEKLQLAVELFRNNPQNVNIEFHSEQNEIFVLINREQIIQVLNNILRNAIQAIPAKQAEKRVVCKITTENKNAVISISDNGTGIDSAIASHLFTPNFTTKSSGSGLGLSISKNIIVDAGGTLTFESEKGKDTVFRIMLPMVD